MHQLRHLPKSSNSTYFAQHSICRSLFSKRPICKAFKSVNNYKSFRTAINLTKYRLPANPAYVKTINQGFKNVLARLSTKRIKRRRLSTKRIKRRRLIRIRIRTQCDQESESDRSRRLTSTAKQKTRDAYLYKIKSLGGQLLFVETSTAGIFARKKNKKQEEGFRRQEGHGAHGGGSRDRGDGLWTAQ